MWYCPTEGTYVVIQDGHLVHTCPSEDIKPHTITGATCSCNPEVVLCDEQDIHVVHIRFSETEAIEKSMGQIFPLAI